MEPADLPELTALPAAVRGRLLELAAGALDGLPPAQMPASLARVARFTPGKRARLGAVPLAEALQSDAAFRAAVAQAGAGVTDPADPVDLAAGAYLQKLPDLAERLAAVPATTDAAGRDPHEWPRRVRRLERELSAVSAERDRLVAARTGTETQEQALDRLRQRLRDQGTRLRTAEDTVAALQQQLAASAAATAAGLETARAEADSWEKRAKQAADRADRAEQALGRAREAGRDDRAAADRRLDLLLTTLEGAAGGLRREWNLLGGGADPADVVGRDLGVGAPAAETTADPGRLLRWLGLPAAHLIVDGYNVTKSGYPDLTLVQQRERLVRSAGALAARTGAEVTVVFDGAAVTVPQMPGRRVRVLFSPPGVLADDVVRDLAAAEPAGRVVVVISSDREVMDGARARGARTAGAPVLLALLT
ncbi:RNA-binding protein [Nakamurella sp. YIM 132087]|uniref:RNA-binding protein n=1 Tax=Nakamurella alba TaxID=2665158 RepID=A0A7K1FT79_9ACTN|nr:NYN domain-containing protein [Nakamurella alba]MTD17362.1 RNA-binding protein [Nakamurella alba]